MWKGVEQQAETAFSDWTKFFMGALLQGTFSYMLASVYEGSAYLAKTAGWERSVQSVTGVSFQWFLGVNLTLLAIPFLLLNRIQMGKNQTMVKVGGKQA